VMHSSTDVYDGLGAEGRSRKEESCRRASSLGHLDLGHVRRLDIVGEDLTLVLLHRASDARLGAKLRSDCERRRDQWMLCETRRAESRDAQAIRPQGTTARASAMKPTSDDAQSNPSLSYIVTPKKGNCRRRRFVRTDQSARLNKRLAAHGRAEDVAEERLSGLARRRVAVVDVADVEVGRKVDRVAVQGAREGKSASGSSAPADDETTK